MAGGGSHATKNFAVTVADDFAPDLLSNPAELIAVQAEHQRQSLFKFWFDGRMPNWSAPAKLHVTTGPASGQSLFDFERGEVINWNVTVTGRDLEEVIEDVLPHEINHLVFASHFRKPLPRWYDEGAAVWVQRKDTAANFTAILSQQEQIPFRQLLVMREYAAGSAVGSQYAQGVVLTDLLMRRGDAEDYVELAENYLAGKTWDQAFHSVYKLTLPEVEQQYRQHVEAEITTGIVANRPQFTLTTVVVYGTTWCQPCQQVKADIADGYYSELPVEFVFHDVERNPPTLPIKGVPDFGIGPDHYGAGSPDGRPYNKAAVKRWISDKLKATSAAPSIPSAPVAGTPLAQPATPAEPLVDVDWSAVHVVALASDNTPTSAAFLRGPFDRLLAMASGQQTQMDVITQSGSPVRYRAVTEAASVEPMPIHILVMIGKSAEVGFFKGKILERIEAGIEDKLADTKLGVLIEPVFERTHSRHWAAINAALAIVEPGKIAPADPDADPAEDADTEDADPRSHSVVAFVVGLFCCMKLVRVGRSVWTDQKEKMLAHMDSEPGNGSPASAAGTANQQSPSVSQ